MDSITIGAALFILIAWILSRFIDWDTDTEELK